MNSRLLFIHALSPLHAGTGQGVGVIDLPIAREKATGLPYLPGSSLKGVLRDQCNDKDLREQMFGPEGNQADKHAGAMQFSDQRLLLFPVRSLAGTFAWVTSPFVLKRLVRDFESIDTQNLPATDFAVKTLEECLITTEETKLKVDNRIYLEDLDLKPTGHPLVDHWSKWIGERIFPNNSEWQVFLHERFCLVHDDILSFLLETATEITARIKLEEATKTVAQGALWYEEALPAETILSGIVVETPTREMEKKSSPGSLFIELNKLVLTPLQFGGKATVGRGLCLAHLPL